MTVGKRNMKPVFAKKMTDIGVQITKDDKTKKYGLYVDIVADGDMDTYILDEHGIEVLLAVLYEYRGKIKQLNSGEDGYVIL